MLDLRATSIIYQSETSVLDQVDDLITKRRLGKKHDKLWDKIDLIIEYLEAYEERTKLDDITQMNYVLECLIKLSGINDYPAAPTLTQLEPPAILIGIPGTDGQDGDQGIQGERGETGLATDFQVASIVVPTTVDSFDVDDAKGARWDYVAIKSTGEQRVGSILGHWTTDGASIEFVDNSSDDIGGSTASLEFEVEYSSGNINLVAVPSSGQWTVTGSRYFIPNNGNGTGPISDVLSPGYVYIGNLSGQAQERLVSGDITLDYLGAASISAGVITNADINASAGISVTKLEALTPSLITATNGSGFLTTLATSTYPSLTELSYVKGVTSAVQTQLNSKLTDPMTTIGDIIIRNGSNVTVRLSAGSPGQVLTISGGVPSWQTPAAGFSDPMTTAGDLIHRNSGNVTARLALGTSGLVLKSNGTVPTWGTIGPVVTNVLTKDDGSGNLITSNIVSTTSGSTHTLTFGTGTALVNLVSGTGGDIAAVIGTDQGFRVRNVADTQRFHVNFQSVSNSVVLTASGSSVNNVIFTLGTKSTILGDGGLLYYGNDYHSSFSTRTLVDKAYVDNITTGGTGNLSVSTITVSNTGSFSTIGIGAPYDGVNPLTISGNARQYTGDFQIDTGGLRFTATGTRFAVKLVAYTWNMHSNISTSVAHGLTATNIVSITTGIRNDGGTTFVSPNSTLTSNVFQINGWDGTNVFLEHDGSFTGNFDYFSTIVNRGYLVITYRV